MPREEHVALARPEQRPRRRPQPPQQPVAVQAVVHGRHLPHHGLQPAERRADLRGGAVGLLITGTMIRRRVTHQSNMSGNP